MSLSEWTIGILAVVFVANAAAVLALGLTWLTLWLFT